MPLTSPGSVKAQLIRDVSFSALMADKAGRKVEGGIEIAFPITRQDLSELTATSLADLPVVLISKVDTVSRACLITAITALGIKTSLNGLTEVGGGHLAIIVFLTMALSLVASIAMLWLDLI